MPTELIPILALAVMFLAATVLPVNMGALGFVAAFFVGTIAVGMDTDDIIAGFPSSLFLTLVGITYLFAIAQNNGTVDLMVRGARPARPRTCRADPLGDVRHHGGTDLDRRARPRRGRRSSRPSLSASPPATRSTRC